MKKLILVGIIAIFMTISPLHTEADFRPLSNKEMAQRLVDKYSKEYNVSATRMMAVLSCENRDFNPSLQSSLKYTRTHKDWGVKKGQREQSFGVAQIHLPAHPNITYEQATDPNFSIEFMAKEFQSGHANAWSCYKT